MKKPHSLSFLFKTALVLSLVICPLLGTAQTRIAIFGGSVAQFFNDRGAQDVLAAMSRNRRNTQNRIGAMRRRQSPIRHIHNMVLHKRHLGQPDRNIVRLYRGRRL